jgi:transposase
MARPGPDQRKVEAARKLAAGGMSREDIAAALDVSGRTLSRWLGRSPGRPANGASRWAEQRRKERGESGKTS